MQGDHGSRWTPFRVSEGRGCLSASSFLAMTTVCFDLRREHPAREYPCYGGCLVVVIRSLSGLHSTSSSESQTGIDGQSDSSLFLSDDVVNDLLVKIREHPTERLHHRPVFCSL